MSVKIVQDEIARFLVSKDPEVLCISGKWGVGKTYNWQEIFKTAEKNQKIGLNRYAYVSLFGLNSLSDLKNAIVENTVLISNSEDESTATISKIWKRRESYLRKSMPLLDLATGMLRVKDAGDALFRVAFLAAKNQIICFDDLERSGKSLEFRDILGLASMLREQRGCKIVLLFNKEKFDADQKSEFDSQLEKVVDTFLVFEPSSLEAIDIAVKENDEILIKLRERLLALKIANIRVIKKIERWVKQVTNILSGQSSAVIDQAISTVALAGAGALHSNETPSFEFVKSFNPWLVLTDTDNIIDEQKKWYDFIQDYGYTYTDDLDREIIVGIERGYFDGSKLKLLGIEADQRLSQGPSSFDKAWDLIHGAITLDDDIILDRLFDGAIENLAHISPININGTVKYLRRYGRLEQASDIIKKYIQLNKDDEQFLDGWDDFIDESDNEFSNAMNLARVSIVDKRDPVEMLKEISKNKSFNPDKDVALLEKLSKDELIKIFDENEGRDLKRIIEWAGILAGQPQAIKLKDNFDLAIQEIAARSPIRRDRLKSWGALKDQQDED